LSEDLGDPLGSIERTEYRILGDPYEVVDP
jgi:hypothetical protein